MVLFVANFYLIAVGAALVRGIEPIFSKRGLESGGNWMANTLTVLFIRVVLFWSILLVVSGNLSGVVRGLSLPTVGIFVVTGVLAAGVGQLAFYVGVDRVGSSVASTVTNVRPLFAVLLGASFLGERVTALMGVGVLVLIVGLFLLSTSRGGDISGWQTRDLVFPLVAAGAFASGNVLRRFGLSTTSVTVLQALAINDLAALFAILGYAIVRRPVASSPSRRSYEYFVLSGLTVAIAMFLLFEALDRGPVSVVDPLLGTTPLFTALFTYLFLRGLERITKRFLVGAVFMVLGVVLITV